MKTRIAVTTGALCCAALIILGLSPATHAQQPALEKIRVVCLNRPIPAVIAQSQGMFARRGLDVEFVVVPGSDVLRNNLAAGTGDVAFIAADNAVAMANSGADVVIVMGGESSMNELIVQPEIKSVSDLRGRTALVDAPNTAYALQLKKILLMNGLQPGKDVEIKQAGSTASRLQGMKDDKHNGASIMNPPFTILAKKAGFVSFGSMQKLLGVDQDRATFALRSWAREHSDLLERYLAGYIEGQRWLMSPANKSQVIALIAKEINLSDEIAGEWYTAEVEAGGYAKDARFDADGFKTNLALRAEVEGGASATAPTPEKYFDLSYYRVALSQVK